MSAKSAYLKGEPTMSDDEFDKLKKELKEEKSKIAVSTEPKCFIDTGICTVTLQEDEFRNNLLNLPLGIVFTLLWTIVSYEVFVGEFFFLLFSFRFCCVFVSIRFRFHLFISFVSFFVCFAFCLLLSFLSFSLTLLSFLFLFPFPSFAPPTRPKICRIFGPVLLIFYGIYIFMNFS